MYKINGTNNGTAVNLSRDQMIQVHAPVYFDVDSSKGTDYFTTLSVEEGKSFWHHREFIRYKYGKSKKLDESLDFIESKYKELHELVEPLEKEIK